MRKSVLLRKYLHNRDAVRHRRAFIRHSSHGKSRRVPASGRREHLLTVWPAPSHLPLCEEVNEPRKGRPVGEVRIITTGDGWTMEQ